MTPRTRPPHPPPREPPRLLATVDGRTSVLSSSWPTASSDTCSKAASLALLERSRRPVPDASDPEVLAKLAAKHPAAAPPAEVVDDTPALEVDVATVRAVISRWRSKRGTAPGLTGLTPEHLVAAADASDDTLSAMVALVNLMLSGRLPRSHDLLDSALLGLLKPNGDVRPIAIGEVWYRFAAACALAALGSPGSDLAPMQLGAGISL